MPLSLLNRFGASPFVEDLMRADETKSGNLAVKSKGAHLKRAPEHVHQLCEESEHGPREAVPGEPAVH